MQLEDHVGDILAKARAGSGLGMAEVAAAAGMETGEYEELEQTGRSRRSPDYARLGKLLSLDAGKLEGIAGGWVPQARALGTWKHLEKITTDRGVAVNCYLIWDEATRDAALFDTGWDAGPVFELIGLHGLELRYLCITHSHADHVAAVEEVRRRIYGVSILGGGEKPGTVLRWLRPGEAMKVGRLRITSSPTPGHAEDGTTFVISGWSGGAPDVAVVGDAIFAGSMGGAGPRLGLARERVREAILSLNPPTLICPGHGPVTTVEEERRHNPFVI